MSEYALQLNNITKKYNDGESENIVLKDISLNVKHGEFVAIVGPSGSGKSTLLSIAGMLLSPNSGEIVLNGKCLSDEKQKNWTKIRRKQIGFIFQNHQLLPYLTVEDQLKLVKNMNKETSLDVNETLKELGLKDCAKKYPSNMSGGEKQRIAIARAFMNNPDVILADEPTASLDGDRGRQVVEMIKKEVMKHNKAAVMVTHDERILDLVDVIYRMDKGILVRDN